MLAKILARPIFILAGVLVLALIVFGVLVVPSLLGGSPQTAQAAAKPTAKVGEADKAVTGPTYVIKDRIINLADAGGRRFLRIGLALEFEIRDDKTPEALGKASAEEKKKLMKELQDEIAQKGPIIDDIVTTVLSGKTFNDVITLEGKDAIKKEIKTRVNEALHGEEKLANVYITDFVVQ
jgi:flagellar FliL protein